MLELLKKENTEIKKKYEKETKKLSKEIAKLKKKPNNITINNTNNSKNSITNNIQLNSYGKENTEYLANPGFINQIKMQSNLLGLLTYQNRKHCDPDHKENWNIGITNLKHDTCKVYKNNKWETRKTSEVVVENFMRGASELQDFMEVVVSDNGRQPDKNGELLDKHEQDIIDSYDKATCSDVLDEFYVKKLKEAMDKHKQRLYDHTNIYKSDFMLRWNQ